MVRSRFAGRLSLLFLSFVAVLLIFPAMAFAQTTTPTIQSDKDDYAPGELVTLTGSGWQAGESVHIYVEDDQGKTWNRNVDVTADGSGNITDSFNLPEWFVATYSVKATGASGAVATTSFTDASLTLKRGPTGDPPNVTYTATYQAFTNNTCTTGGGSSQSATVNSDAGTSLGGLGGGSGGFVKLTAPVSPTSPSGYTFDKWTAEGDNLTILATSDGGRSICVRNPTASQDDIYRATYKVANTAPTISDIGPQTSTEDNAISAVPFTVGDAQTPAADLTLSGSSSNTTLVPNNNITFGGSGANRTVTVTPATDQSGTATITVTVTDAGDLTASDTFTATFTAVNDKPVIDLNGAAAGTGHSAAFTEDGGAVSIVDGSALSITDVDNTTLASATVKITNLKDGAAESLDANVGSTGITKSYNSSTGVLTLTGPGTPPQATLAQFQQVLRTVTYNNTSQNPDNTARLVDFVVNDGAAANANSDAATSTVAVNALNDAPVLANIESGGLPYTENDAPKAITSALSVSDVDNANLTGATVAITAGYQNGQDVLAFTNQNNISGSWNATTGTLTLSGSASLANYQAALRSVTYENTSDNPSTAARTVTFRVNDGGSQNNLSNSATRNINVTAVNDPPVVEFTNPSADSQTLDENKTTTRLYTYTVTDVDNANPTVVDESCGSGSKQPDEAGDPQNSFRCLFPDDAITTVSATADDGEASNNTGTDTIGVTVNNVAPKVHLTGLNEVKEGDTEWYYFAITDPGNDTFSFPAGYPTCDLSNNQKGQVVGTPNIADLKFQCFFPDGYKTTDVAVKVKDDDGGVSVADTEHVEILNVTINNVPPAVTDAPDQSSDEGENHSFDLGTFTDPGPDGPWQVSVDWGDNTTPTSFSVSAPPTAPDTLPQKSHAYADNGTYTVTVTVTENSTLTPKPSGSDTFDVTVANVAPSGTLGNDGPKPEGSAVNVSFTGVTDPSSVDAASLRYAFSCQGGDLSGVTYANASPNSSTNCTFNDDSGAGTFNVTGVIIDKDGGRHNANTAVKVTNAAPNVTLSGPTTGINEGDTKHYTYSWTDAGSADTFPPAGNSVSCGQDNTVSNAVFDGTSKSGSFDCTFNDNSGANPFAVSATVKDDDGGTGTDTKPVTVANLNPTIGSVTNNGPINEGQSATISVNNASDPAGANDPLSYEFDCKNDGTYDAAAQPGNTFQCSYNDDGTYTVNVRVSDGDGGVVTGSTTVTVNNVAPTINSFTASSVNVLTGGINKVKFTANATAGPSDTITYTWSGGDPGTANANTYTAGFMSCGEKTVTVTATDDDGSQAQLTKTVNAWNAIFQPPIKDGSINTAAKGQVVPVKVTIGCGTTSLTTLQPVIQLINGDATPENDSGTAAITVSASAADSGVYMRPIDGGYIYNLLTPSAAAGTKYTIRINPWGAAPAGVSQADWNLATGMYALLQIRK